MSFFVHPQGLCESGRIGEGTRIWAFAHVLPGAVLGRDCNICDGVFVENDVVVGDSVTVKCGVQLWDGLRIGNRVFIGPNATFTNDRFPRSKQYPESFAETVVADDVSIGANATILPGVKIGRGAMIGAGAVVLADVAPRAVIVGNPGRVAGYAGATEIGEGEDLPADFAAKLLRLPGHANRLGRLSVLEAGNLPFVPQRLFTIDRVPTGQGRGAHAHKECHQLLVAMSGRVKAAIDDGHRAFVVTLDGPDKALHMPPGLWGTQFGHSDGAVLSVLASHRYDPADYITDYAAFCAR